MAEKKPDEMTEEELARFYEERRGDVSLWQKAPRKIRARRGGPSTVFALRLTPEELMKLQAAALKGETTVSDFIRSAALREASTPMVAPAALQSLREHIERSGAEVRAASEALGELDKDIIWRARSNTGSLRRRQASQSTGT